MVTRVQVGCVQCEDNAILVHLSDLPHLSLLFSLFVSQVAIEDNGDGTVDQFVGPVLGLARHSSPDAVVGCARVRG